MKNVLFVCSENRLRSPTAEQVFADWPGIEVHSAGTNSNCPNPVTPELLAWADIILVMEDEHRRKILKTFRADIRDQRIYVLRIPDDYEYMEPRLVDLLKERAMPFLPRRPRAPSEG